MQSRVPISGFGKSDALRRLSEAGLVGESEEMTCLASCLGVASAACAFTAAIIWGRSGMITWHMGREGLPLGQYVSPPGTYHGPNDLSAYFRRVSRLNCWAAFWTGVSVFLGAFETALQTLGSPPP